MKIRTNSRKLARCKFRRNSLCKSKRRTRCKKRKKSRQTTQKVIVKKIIKKVRVKAKNLDIRRLRSKKDSVQIFGFDGSELKPIRTDDQGRIEVGIVIPKRQFYEEKFLDILADDDWTAIPVQDTSRFAVYSYGIVNKGENQAIIQVQISPNSNDFATDRVETVEPNQTLVMIPTRFMHYTRLLVSCHEPSETTLVDVYFQAQST